MDKVIANVNVLQEHKKMKQIILICVNTTFDLS
jgi:hypothetical protein